MANSESYLSVEKGVEIPRKGSTVTGRPRKYPFDRMDAGDSFAVPNELYDSVRTLASFYGRISGMEFTVRKIDDEIRVWRVA